VECRYLESKQQQESHHEAEQAHSLRQGKSQDGEGEKLALERGVPGIADDEGAEHAANASTRSGHTDGGGTSTNVLGSLVNVTAHSRGLQAADLAHDGGLSSNLQRADATVGSHVATGLLLDSHGAAKRPQGRAGEEAHASCGGLGDLSGSNHFDCLWLSGRQRT